MASETFGQLNQYAASRGKRAGECPNCKNRTALELADQRRLWPKLTSNLVQPPGAFVMEHAWRCTYCGETTLILSRYPAGEPDREPEELIQAWPPRQPRSLDDVVPAAIRSLYVEASRAEAAGALRGAAGLYRAAVEGICVDRNADGRNLAERIDALEEVGLGQDVVRDLHEARLLGNWSLHDGLEFTSEEVADVAELIAEACYLLYVQPAERQALRKQRQARREAFRTQGPPPSP